MEPSADQKFYYPSDDVLENAYVKEYDKMYKFSIENREKFWAEQAEQLHWFKKWDTMLDAGNPPFYKWFNGGKTNIVYNALDRHQLTAVRNKLPSFGKENQGTSGLSHIMP